ncbi:hypothetical protein DBR40_24675 [Pedobacter sp. KBW01]|uniref:hypothetical protein n=1 Tax=Pedobacter sp. KBW01 TaxID=2153364 RepID=UPI000F5A9DFC|nr:hypothetical protein [Pedobacter sp. KBW01]RQO65071.1 hypothetical protein DBR40_24675 [Pedobacter sp. KBW01]
MLKILNDSGKALELNYDTTIPVERNNSLFNDPDKFVQDITYSGKAKLTPNNKIFIQYGHLVEADRKVYELPVRVLYSGVTFFVGIFSYKIVSNEIEFILKVNYGAVAKKLKHAGVREIYTFDPDYSHPTQANFQAHMKNTCVNPLNYNCVFFPVFNDKWDDSGLDIAYKMINYWDHEAQQFKVDKGRPNTIEAPFFRLSYLIKKMLEYLNFKVEGGYFTDPDELNIYVFTRRAMLGYGILPSLGYLPDIKMSECLKQAAQRRRISIDFDAPTNTISVETPKSVLINKEYIDISQYIESIQSIAAPEQKGYSVKLKLDESDPAWNTGIGDAPVYKAPYILKVGQGENEIEMEIGTLRLKEDETANYPQNQQTFSIYQTEDINTWPISLLHYSGMKNVAGGKVFPQAKPLDLNVDDALWWRFLNASKPLIITANIPPSIVERMKPRIKLGCKSEQGHFFLVLPKKISYAFQNKKTDLMRVKIEAHTMDVGNDTTVFIDTIDPEEIVSRSISRYKAYWDPKVHGFNELRIERIPLSGSTATYGFTPITLPTDDGGAGGDVGTAYRIQGPRDSPNETRLYCNTPPKYYVAVGVKGSFVAHSGYYTFAPLPIGAGVPDNTKPIWIVF